MPRDINLQFQGEDKERKKRIYDYLKSKQPEIVEQEQLVAEDYSRFGINANVPEPIQESGGYDIPSVDYNKKMSQLESKINSLRKEAATVPGEKQDWDAKLAAAQQKLESTRNRENWLELAGLLSAELTKLGAAIYGRKKGYNLAGLEIKPYSGAEQKAFAERQYERELGAVERGRAKEEREEEAVRREKREEIRDMQSELNTLYRMQSSEIRQALKDKLAEKKLQAKEQAASDKEAKQKAELLNQAKISVENYLRAESEKDKIRTRAAAESALGQAGVTVQDVRELFEKPAKGWITEKPIFGAETEPKTPEEVRAKLEQISPQTAFGKGVQTQLESGTTRMYKNGRVFEIPNNEVEEAKAAGYKLER